eukprot:CAMPEP_0171351322 /NCGR_PEP_ID=MMETSP0878-20121228/38666_1 /TAXON_ID=67004 /ORGANISM="Thalassiosira weissflogii, Strain CCMP1336" /LENGTH=46 /DNA_ID= /DNA_START= /DNA_END= /DNA_ORIENTATION=
MVIFLGWNDANVAVAFYFVSVSAAVVIAATGTTGIGRKQRYTASHA